MAAKTFRILAAIFLILVLPHHSQAAKRIILFVGDGMGSEIIRAWKIKTHGSRAYAFAAPLPFETAEFTVRSSVRTNAADNPVTDSASSATAMATGQKVDKGVLSAAIPGDGSPLQTICEISSKKGLSTGLVTTASVTDATPAAFFAHRKSRNDRKGVAADFMKPSGPALLIGGGDSNLTEGKLRDAGFTLLPCEGKRVTDTVPEGARLALLCGDGDFPYVAERAPEIPGLVKLVLTALDHLDRDPDGFFLLVEGGRIDDAAHDGDLRKTLMETEEFFAALQTAVQWANGHDNILLAVTADHDTGGLVLNQDSETLPGGIPSGTFTTRGHTARSVMFYAAGSAQGLPPEIDNTGIFFFLRSFLDDSAPAE